MGDGVGKTLDFIGIVLNFPFQAFAVSDVQGIFNHLGDIAMFVKNGIRMDFHIPGVAVLIIMDVLDNDRLFSALYFLERTDMLAAVAGELPPVRQGITGGVIV